MIRFIRGILGRFFRVLAVKKAANRLSKSWVHTASKQRGSKKVVIWGHKLHTHTHSYIHSSYFRAFGALGYDTYWFDDRDDISGFDFRDCIFLTEAQVDGKIPLDSSSFYVLHHCDTGKYSEAGCRHINLCNYVHDCRLGRSFNYAGAPLKEMTYYSYYDEKNRALYQPWGTDLLPSEIPGSPLVYDEKRKNIYYIGTKTPENALLIEEFAKACADNRKKLELKKFVSDREGRNLIERSYIYPDIRDAHHVAVGYMPCRIFKNISYGAVPATNSVFVRDFFPGAVLPYSADAYGLFRANEAYVSDAANLGSARWLMEEVRAHHTYITRAGTILYIMGAL